MRLCIVCGRRTPTLTGAVPNYYCPACYRAWAWRENEPWLKFLVRSEVRLRVRAHRGRKRGLRTVEVPLNRTPPGNETRWYCAACLTASPPAWEQWSCPECGHVRRIREKVAA